MKRLFTVLFVTALTAAACGSSKATPATTAKPATSAPVAAGTPNEVDVRFSQGGLGHHAQAVELAEIALDPKATARPEILALGKAITAPSPEFSAIEGLLKKWNQPLELSKEEMAKMDGMATQATIDKLATVSGTEFDTMFLNTLVKHHEGAIKMAEKAISEGSHPDLKPIATKLLAMRTSELTAIQALLG